jgi:hypothetical protein
LVISVILSGKNNFQAVVEAFSVAIESGATTILLGRLSPALLAAKVMPGRQDVQKTILVGPGMGV